MKAFSNTKAEQVPEIVHAKGTSFDFNTEIQKPWVWQEMVAQLDDKSMQLVVEGPHCRSRGEEPQSRNPALVGCCIKQMNTYDHKRHCAHPNKTEMMKEWDFVVFRDDGSCICLHPNYANTHVAAKHNEPQADVQLPDSGMGGTSGPGTFKHFTMKAVDITLRFDAQRNRSRGKNYWPKPLLEAPPLPPTGLRLGPHVPPPPILQQPTSSA